MHTGAGAVQEAAAPARGDLQMNHKNPLTYTSTTIVKRRTLVHSSPFQSLSCLHTFASLCLALAAHSCLRTHLCLPLSCPCTPFLPLYTPLPPFVLPLQPKTFFAAERTFLSWLNVAVLLTFVALSLMVSDEHTHNKSILLVRVHWCDAHLPVLAQCGRPPYLCGPVSDGE